MFFAWRPVIPCRDSELPKSAELRKTIVNTLLTRSGSNHLIRAQGARKL